MIFVKDLIWLTLILSCSFEREVSFSKVWAKVEEYSEFLVSKLKEFFDKEKINKNIIKAY